MTTLVAPYAKRRDFVSCVFMSPTRTYIAKVGFCRTPASCGAEAGCRPLEMALKLPKKGYIPFIASQKCLKRNLGGGRTRGSCPPLWRYFNVLCPALRCSTAATAGRGMQPIARTNARTHTSTIRADTHRFAVEPTTDRTAWRIRRHSPRYVRYAAVRCGCCRVPRLVVYSNQCPTHAVCTEGECAGSLQRKSCYATLIPAGRDRTAASRA